MQEARKICYGMQRTLLTLLTLLASQLVSGRNQHGAISQRAFDLDPLWTFLVGQSLNPVSPPAYSTLGSISPSCLRWAGPLAFLSPPVTFLSVHMKAGAHPPADSELPPRYPPPASH